MAKVEKKIPAQSITIEAWARNKFGAKNLDQAKAFARDAAKQGQLTKRSSVEWDALHATFLNRPAGMK